MTPTAILDRSARTLEALIEALGRAVAWLAVALVALMFGLVVARYAFGLGSVAAQELTLWLSSAVFLIGAAFALKRDAHVRVDIFYRGFSVRGRALVDFIGTALFLLPFAGLLLAVSYDYAAQSWAIGEGSREPGGLPAVYLLKSLIPLAALLLLIQGLAWLLRAIAVLIDAGDAVDAAARTPPR